MFDLLFHRSLMVMPTRRCQRGSAELIINCICLYVYGCFLKWWYPQNTPKWSFLVGKSMVVGYHHLRKHPYMGIKSDILGLAKTFGTKWVKKVSFSFL